MSSLPPSKDTGNMLLQFVLISAWSITATLSALEFPWSSEAVTRRLAYRTNLQATPMQQSHSIPHNDKSPEAKHLKNGFLDNSEKLITSEYLGKIKEHPQVLRDRVLAIHQHMKVLTDEAILHNFGELVESKKGELEVFQNELEQLKDMNLFLRNQNKISQNPKIHQCLRKSQEYLTLFSQLKFCKVLGIEHSNMQKLLELIKPDHPYSKIVHQLTDGVLPTISKSKLKEVGNLYMEKIKKLINHYANQGHALQLLEEFPYNQRGTLPYILQTINFLYKHELVDGESVKKLFQDDHVLWITSLETINHLSHSLSLTGNEIKSGLEDLHEHWFWPFDYEFLGGFAS
ncbi:hypothetical protein PGTUg99_035134 [Puccinia graminis f. sp. tritici]|uniref:Uncharacterized protein n=1 Tax=Puccinia graminis f. sp. tritici TaxID=56615 RepID=A0A5B0S849_PUCGR|nr:hypothetical protein PGTUg99_035134 [Puccinia graminis f. sp. tritici]